MSYRNKGSKGQTLVEQKLVAPRLPINHVLQGVKELVGKDLAAHQHYVAEYRKKVMAVVRDIHRGIVNADDLDELQNFVQVSLALMGMVGPRDIEGAWKNAEMLALMAYQEAGVVLPTNPGEEEQAMV